MQDEVNRLLRLKSENAKNAIGNADEEVAVTYLSELYKGNGWTVAFHTGARNHRSLLISAPKQPDTILFIVKFIISNRPLTRDRIKDELTDFENNIGPEYECGQFCIIALHGYEVKAEKLEDYLLLEDWTYIEKLIADYSKDKKQEPHIQLFAHNEKTYKKVKKMMAHAKGVAVVQATGTGKSYLIAKLLHDFAGKRRLVMAPSYYIIDQIKEHIRWETDLPAEANKIDFMTYAKSMYVTPAEINELEPEMIVLDEFHRCGAEEWGRGVQSILNAYPKTFRFGTSATPIRYLDNGRDMSMELFGGHVAEKLNLAQAIVRNILPMPKYVCALYTLSEEITSLRAKIAGSRKNEETKRKLLLDLDTIHIDWERSRGIPHVLKKHYRKHMRKFIIFCKDEAHLNEMEPIVKKWFKEAVDDIPVKTYKVHSKEDERDEQLEAFKNDTSKDHLHLLFSIDMLNEGLHVNEVSGVILLRPTESPIIFYQQIGRCLKVGMSERPVIFDFVNNFKSIRTNDFLYNLDFARKELLDRRTEEGLEDRCPRFDVNDEVRLISELFDEIEFKLDNWNEMYDQLVKFHKRFGNANVPTAWEENPALSTWLLRQRKRQQNDKLDEDQFQTLNELGVKWDFQAAGPSKERWEQQYQELSEYQKKFGHCNVPKRDKGYNALGLWVGVQRRNHRLGKLEKTLIQKLEKIGFVFNPLGEAWERLFAQLEEFRKIAGHCNVKEKESKNDKLFRWVCTQRSNFKKGILEEQKKKRLEEIGFDFSPDENYWQEQFNKLLAYKDKHGHTEVSPSENKSLNMWMLRQRKKKNEGILEPERLEKLNNIGFAWQPGDGIFEIRLEELKKFHLQFHHFTIPPKHPIYSWSRSLKYNHNKGLLTDLQVKKLKSIGFDLTIKETQIEIRDKRFVELQNFYNEHGHIDVTGHKNYARLIIWLDGIRGQKKNGTLSAEFIARLDAMEMDWDRNYLDKKWKKMYEKLRDYYNRTGTTFIERTDKANQELKSWCNKQRKHRKEGDMPKERIEKLDEIGFMWEDYADTVWELRFEELHEFKERYGHCRVTDFYKKQYPKLFTWRVNMLQNLRKGKLSNDRMKMLRAMGFE